MPDLTREDLAAFVALWPRMHVSVSAVTESTLKVLTALRELAAEGGTLTVVDVCAVVGCQGPPAPGGLCDVHRRMYETWPAKAQILEDDFGVVAGDGL